METDIQNEIVGTHTHTKIHIMVPKQLNFGYSLSFVISFEFGQSEHKLRVLKRTYGGLVYFVL